MVTVSDACWCCKEFVKEEDLLETIQSDISQLCGENVLLWAQYLQIVTLNNRVNYELAKQHHTQRVRTPQLMQHWNIDCTQSKIT